MADEETAKRLPYVAFDGVLSEVDRMDRGGIPDRFDRKYLADKADGTQFQYRQGFRDLGLTTDEDHPTPLLATLVDANQTDRRELLGKIMSDRYPELTGLPPDASMDDFFTVLIEQYGVNSDQQRRKMLTFFVKAADYAGLPISPGIRPTKARTGPRKPRRSGRTGAPAKRSRKTTARTPATHPDQGEQTANAMGAQRHDISLGDVGSVSVVMDAARWWELPDNQVIKLRNLIKAIEAFGDSGS
jgi:hypothetical protein